MGGSRSRILVALSLLLCGPAWGDPMEVQVHGASDPAAAIHSCVRPGARFARLDFGVIAPGFQPTGGCRAVTAAEHAGIWLVATLELGVHPGPDLRPGRVRATMAPRRVRVTADKPLSGSSLQTSGALLRPTAARPVEVLLRIEGLTGGVQAWFAPGTGNDWSTARPPGTPLGAADTPVSILPPEGGHVLHQIALFVPQGRAGSVTGRAVYSARADNDSPSRRKR